MKTKLGLLLLLLLIAVGCDDSTHRGEVAEQAAEIAKLQEQVENLQKQATEATPEPTPEPAPEATPEADLEADLVQPTESITNTIGMTLNKIPAGTFMMGSPESEADRVDDETQHRVTISKPFYMQTTEVTQGQWKAVMSYEPWKGQLDVNEGPDYPAVYVSWNDAVAYCKKLSEKKGKTYRLPTEAEWEYACRAGTKTAWSFGNDEKVLGDYAWYRENAEAIGEKYAHQVAQKKPNAWGLHDMHGNVWEWCHDYYGGDYYKQSPKRDPTGPTRGLSGPKGYHIRVQRGGSWEDRFGARYSRSAYHGGGVTAYRYDYRGFRVVRELD
jgi:formylglycine-generating enzyme